MIERTQPAYGAQAPEPAIAEAARPVVTPDRLGTTLVGIAGLYIGHRFNLFGAESRIGRDKECQVSLANDPTVSRLHARIVLEDDGHAIIDEGSSNGTYLNGVLVSRSKLIQGDLVQVGSTQLKYE
jgi:pSer/pThr/pTyr-binding forkhead associated (FHA) protein